MSDITGRRATKAHGFLDAFSILLLSAILAPSRPAFAENPRARAYSRAFLLTDGRPASDLMRPFSLFKPESAARFALTGTGSTFPGLYLPSAETAAPEPERGKKTGLAVAEVIGINLVVWAVGHYVFDQHWSYIGPDTLADNLKYWFEWDPGRFRTNFYNHPYHGSFYFNAGRSNGLDFWGSSLCAFGGGLMWEMMMERHRPSINDLVMTTTGGMFFGEVFHRLSALVRSGRRRGFDRVWREAIGAILDPVGGLNRLLEKGESSGSAPAGKVPLHGQITWAGALIHRKTAEEDTRAVPTIVFDLEYGEPFKENGSFKPLDYFPIQGILRLGPDLPHLSLNAVGLLAGKNLRAKKSARHLLGLFQNFDYISFEEIRLGGSSVCGGILSRFELAPKLRLKTFAQAGWMILGASTNEYIETLYRNYNYGTGWIAKAELAIGIPDFELLQIRWRQYGIRCLEGAAGLDLWNVLIGQVSMPILKKWGIGLLYAQYFRNSRYRDFPNVKQRVYEARAFATYQF